MKKPHYPAAKTRGALRYYSKKKSVVVSQWNPTAKTKIFSSRRLSVVMNYLSDKTNTRDRLVEQLATVKAISNIWQTSLLQNNFN